MQRIYSPAQVAAPTSTDPPLRFVLLRGMVGVATPAELARLCAGLLWWLLLPPLLVRLLGRLGRRAAQHRVERWWARRMVRQLGIQLDIAGLDLLVPNQAYVVTPLHEGFADVLALLHLPLPLRFVARDELFGWRQAGPVLRDSGQLVVTPERGSWSYRRLLRAARPIVAGAESLVVFPQGTILGVEADARLGAFALAKALDLPILPVVLTGSHRVWEHPYTPRLRFGERISLRVLPPIAVETVRGTRAEELRHAVQRQLKARALHGDVAMPRRFVPARDGYWDGFAYRIDPAFAELAADVARHRAEVAAGGVAGTAPI